MQGLAHVNNIPKSDHTMPQQIITHLQPNNASCMPQLNLIAHMNQHANTFQFHLTNKQSIHCSLTRSWLIHTRLLWLIIANVAYNTRMACKISRHDHEYITFTRPSTCCHLRLIVQALTTNGPGSIASYCLKLAS